MSKKFPVIHLHVLNTGKRYWEPINPPPERGEKKEKKRQDLLGGEM